MGIVLRQSFFSSISAYIGVGIGYINAVILMPLFMSPSEIGLMRAVMSIALLLVTFSMFGMGGIVIRYFPLRGSDSKALNQLFTLGLTTIFVSFLIVAASLYLGKDFFFDFFADNAPEVNQFLGLIMLLILQMTVFTFFEAIARSQKDIILPNIVRDLGYKILHALIILLYGFNWVTFKGYLYAHAVSYLLLIIILGIPVIYNYSLKLNFSIFKDTQGIKSMYQYGLISILSGLGMTIIIQIDQIMITKYLGLSENGIYTIAIFMATVIELPRKYISQISSPIISESFAKEDYEAIHDHYKKASINQLILGLFIYLLILTNLESIYQLMPNGEAYENGWWVFFVIGLVKIIDMGFSLNGEIIGYSRYYRFNLYAIIILSVLAIINNILLIPLYGIVGAGLATLFSYLIFNIAKYIFLNIKFGYHAFSVKTALLLLISGIAATICFVLPNTGHILMDVFIRSIIFVSIFSISTYWLNISELFNETFDQVKNRILQLLTSRS